MMITPIEVVNEDGTSISDTPINPLYKKYPACKQEGYKCIYCNNCPSGQYFDYSKLSEKEQSAYNKYLEERRKYDEIHNPSLFMRKKFNAPSDQLKAVKIEACKDCIEKIKNKSGKIIMSHNGIPVKTDY